MNVLSIGNSFSQNAHFLLPSIVKADGDTDFMLCNLYIPGCTLETHWNNMKSEKEAYDYQIYLPGETEMRSTPEVALHEPLEDEEWDIITVQQASGSSGIEESYSPYLEELVGYVRMVAPKAKILFHETWAYSEKTHHPEFPKYSCSTQLMFESIAKATAMAQINADIDGIIPSGVAFQIARQTSIGDNLNIEDGFHANDAGCFLAGACFYEKIFGRSILDNKFVIDSLGPEYTELLRRCAHTACEKAE